MAADDVGASRAPEEHSLPMTRLAASVPSPPSHSFPISLSRSGLSNKGKGKPAQHTPALAPGWKGKHAPDYPCWLEVPNLLEQGAAIAETPSALAPDYVGTALAFGPGDSAPSTLQALSACGTAYAATIAPMQTGQAPAQGRGVAATCRWHRSADAAGAVSDDGHVFTKIAGPRRNRISEHGAQVELASICMVFDESLRCRGVHQYRYEILHGELGPADGAGFVFDSRVRRNNIQRMRSIFLNQRGRICLRNNHQVIKLQPQLPALLVGATLILTVDLDALVARFEVNLGGGEIQAEDVRLESLVDMGVRPGQLRSGFFCAVVTGNISVRLT